MSFFPSFGGAAYSPTSKKLIRLILKGCTNRPFFHISVQETDKDIQDPVIEQIGNYDPLPNEHNEKLVAINYQRLEHWLREGVGVSHAVSKLLGLSGYFPVHPESVRSACDRRKDLANKIKQLSIEVAEIQGQAEQSSTESSSGVSETVASSEGEPSSGVSETVASSEEEPSSGVSETVASSEGEPSSPSVDDNSSEKDPKS